MKKDKIYQLHVEHYHWLENLRFYEDEINYLKRKTGELLIKNVPDEERSRFKELQDKIIRHEAEVDELKKIISNHEIFLKNLKDLSGDNLSRHIEERNRMEHFEKIFTDLKYQCTDFLARA